MTTKEYTDTSKLLARIVIEAYKKPVEQFDDLEELVVGAFIFGAHRIFSMREARVQEWESKIAMVEIFHDVFGYEMETAGNALEFFAEGLDKEKNPGVHDLIVCGADAYPLLSDPDELGTALRKIVATVAENME